VIALFEKAVEDLKSQGAEIVDPVEDISVTCIPWP
jgi:hypothetical protein